MIAPPGIAGAGAPPASPPDGPTPAVRPHRDRPSPWPYLFLSPYLLLTGVFFLVPFINAVVLAFYETNGPRGRVFVGLANFRALWTDRYFWIALENSVKYLAVVPVLQACAIVLAIGVHRSTRGCPE